MASLSTIKRLIIQTCDPDEVCDALDISTEMLVERFSDILSMRLDRFEYLEEESVQEFGDDSEVDYSGY